jgi:uncharacterized protein (TIGR02594 family)
VLREAEKVAHAGPGAVSEYMAAAGYPKNGAWCGEFAASVIRRSGGTPPKNPATASNWRNYGEQVASPQPGDIAVRKPEYHGRLGTGRTGDTGSHVTIVDAVDPKTGRFTGIGGNQGALVNPRFNQSQYDYFRAKQKQVGAAPAPADGTGDVNNRALGQSETGDASRRAIDLERAKQNSEIFRRAIDQSKDQNVNVNATGKLTAHINAPAGTHVSMEGGGLFKKTEINRQTQMAPAAVGPSQHGTGGS